MKFRFPSPGPATLLLFGVSLLLPILLFICVSGLHTQDMGQSMIMAQKQTALILDAPETQTLTLNEYPGSQDQGRRILLSPEEFVLRHPELAATREYRTAMAEGSSQGFHYNSESRLTLRYIAYLPHTGRVWFAETTMAQADVFQARTLVFSLSFLAISLACAWISLVVLMRSRRHAITTLDSFLRGLFADQAPALPRLRGPGEIMQLRTSMEEVHRAHSADHQDMEQRQQELLMLLETMDEGIMVLDQKKRLLRINPFACRLFNLDAEASLGRSFYDLVRSSTVLDLVDRTWKGEDCPGAETTLFSPRDLYLKVSVRRLISPRDGSLRLMLLFTDITELKKLEEVRKDFVANVSHELRTPITAIRGFAETILDDPSSRPEDTRRFVQIIHRQSMRLQGIIEDLLSLSRLEQLGGKISKDAGRARELVLSALEVCESQAQKKRTLLELEGEDFGLTCNRPLMEQALINLIANAVNHCPEGSRVQITPELRQGEAGLEAWFTVRDNGPGIPAKDQGRLFERFYRVDKARSRNAGGTGLGLSIVRHIAAAHAGRVGLESTPGKGSAFSIIIPAEDSGQVSE